ncbi:hypothetical protein WM23_22365 [Burkholderia ubonensis]|nr:hypothetical protein WM23_22365 [Burkholderia ubonensis]
MSDHPLDRADRTTGLPLREDLAQCAQLHVVALTGTGAVTFYIVNFVDAQFHGLVCLAQQCLLCKSIGGRQPITLTIMIDETTENGRIDGLSSRKRVRQAPQKHDPDTLRPPNAIRFQTKRFALAIGGSQTGARIEQV